MISLAYPWLLLLALLPLAFTLGKPKREPIAVPVLPVGHWLADMPGVQTSGRPTPRWRQLVLLAAWLCLVTALARPQYVGENTQMPITGRDLMLLVDISPSMEERDMVQLGRSLNRLQAVKQVLDEFIDRRKGDRLGLILFGTQPYVQAPLTFDRETVRTLLNEAGLGMAGRATAIGDAVGLSVKRLRERPQQQRVAILLTDGANTAGEITPDKAAELARAASVRLYTIGIGAGSTFNRSRDLDEGLLIRMAQQTGGEYFRARDLQELSGIYDTIDQLEPIEQDGQTYRPVTDLYPWPAGLAIVLWLLLMATRWPGSLHLARKTGERHRG